MTLTKSILLGLCYLAIVWGAYRLAVAYQQRREQVRIEVVEP